MLSSSTLVIYSNVDNNNNKLLKYVYLNQMYEFIFKAEF